MSKRIFNVATDEEVKSGLTSDIYYLRTRDVLEAKGCDRHVSAEVSAGVLPSGWRWGVFCGLDEVLSLYSGLPVDLYAIPEGTVFPVRDASGFRLPQLSVSGMYTSFVSVETATVGLLCQASGVATAAARVKMAARGKSVFAFGIRRMHPALSPMLDRSAYIGGFDGVSGIAGAKLIGADATGTMPHPLMLIFGDQRKAWEAFDEVVDRKVQRIALVDTFCDEKNEAILAAETLGRRLFGVRLDTPGSRRGDFLEIVREVRWELDLRGHKDVKIFVSGGLDEHSVAKLSSGPVDGFGVGTSVSNAPTVDFSMDLVEVAGVPRAKRGKYGGRKQAWRCSGCYSWSVAPWDRTMEKCPHCGGSMEAMMVKMIEGGKLIRKPEKAEDVRRRVLEQLKRYTLE